MEYITIEDIYGAYYDCRKHKRSTPNAMMFEVELERNLYTLWEEINNGTYRIGKSICFVVPRPKYREVFAADFRDRIVHHLVIRKLEPLFEEDFIPDTYNCRVGKGTLYGISRLKEKIQLASEGYTKGVYVGKFDCKGFFMSIDKARLWRMLRQYVERRYDAPDKPCMLRLLEMMVMHCPEKDCIKRSDENSWSHLSKDKSLFTCGEGRGLPIGNLSSQILANFYLTPFDRMMTERFGGFYGRYVDDFYIISDGKRKIVDSIPYMRSFLADYGVTLHPDKVYIQHYSKGIKFTGGVVKFDRRYVGASTLHGFKNCISELNRVTDKLAYAPKAVQRLNSYLGYCRQFLSYGLRIKIMKTLSHNWRKYLYITGRCQKVVLRLKICISYD